MFGTRKEDGIPPVGIKVLREREKRLLLDFIRDNLKQLKKEERSEKYMHLVLLWHSHSKYHNERW